MIKNKVYLLVSASLIIFLAACSAPPISPTNTQSTDIAQGTATITAAETTATVAGGTPVGGADLCTNVYYPVRQGAKWTYKSSGGPAGE